MTRLDMRLDRSASGAWAGDEDRWTLVHDTDDGRLFVEHGWGHAGARGGGEGDVGRDEIGISEFLSQGGPGVAELDRAIRRIFVGRRGA